MAGTGESVQNRTDRGVGVGVGEGGGTARKNHKITGNRGTWDKDRDQKYGTEHHGGGEDLIQIDWPAKDSPGDTSRALACREGPVTTARLFVSWLRCFLVV